MTQYLYLIKCQSFYKIGVANDVESRLAQLSTGNPFPLEVKVVYAFQNAAPVETVLHQKFSDKRRRGEWFELNYQDTKDMHQICLLLGGGAFEYTGQEATDEAIEEAEQVDVSLEDVRTEMRMSNGEPRGVVLFARGKERKQVAYIGKTHEDFDKYLERYKQEHPNSRIDSLRSNGNAESEPTK